MATPLLQVSKVSKNSHQGHRWFQVRSCIKSKPAQLILLWNLSVYLAYKGLYNVDAIIQVSHSSKVLASSTALFTVFAVFWDNEKHWSANPQHTHSLWKAQVNSYVVHCTYLPCYTDALVVVTKTTRGSDPLSNRFDLGLFVLLFCLLAVGLVALLVHASSVLCCLSCSSEF